MPAVRRTRIVELLWRVHRWAYTASGGRLGRNVSGMPILLLTTTGRKSGRSRTVALQHLVDGEAFVVIASNAGEPTPPSWLLNLRAHPDAAVRLGRRSFAVRAREATGDERARLWRAVVEADQAYGVYQRRTRRNVAVVVLQPALTGVGPTGDS